MAWSKTQNWNDTGAWQIGNNATASVVTLTNVPAAGSLVVAASWCDGTTVTYTPSDNFSDGNSWNTVFATPQADSISVERIQIFWKQVGTPSGGGKAITLTPSGAATNKGFAAAEFNPGAGTTVSIDGTPISGNGNGSGTYSTGGITAAVGGLAIGVVSQNSVDPTPNASYTGTVITANGWFQYVEELLNSPSGATDPSWTSGTSGFWLAAGVVFKATGGGGSGVSVAWFRA